MNNFNNKKDIVIIIQAPLEIIHALALYEKTKNSARISIVVVRIKSSYNYLKSLNLNLSSLLFIPYPKIKSFYSLYSLFTLKLAINRAINDNFSNVRNSQIYFYGTAFDYFTIPILLHLKAKNSCTYLYTNSIGNRLNQAKKINQYRIKDYLLLIIFWLLTWHKLDISVRRVMLLIPEKHSMNSKLISDNPTEVLNKFSKKLEFKQPSILFFESSSATIAISNYQEVMLKIISFINKQDINIYIKPHPEKGYSSFLDKTNVIMLDQTTPGEFIDLTNVNLILGIYTSAIMKIAKNSPMAKVLSLAGLFEFYDGMDQENRMFNILRQIDGIEIIHDINDFEDIINNLKWS
jgi:hypothetical protein